jgi:hypothetical protein
MRARAAARRLPPRRGECRSQVMHQYSDAHPQHRPRKNVTWVVHAKMEATQRDPRRPERARRKDEPVRMRHAPGRSQRRR